MPIYEYRCGACAHEFEALLRPGDVPACPECGSGEAERRLSVPAVKSSATRAQAMRAAKKRDASQATDRLHERLRTEESHDRHG